MIPLNVKRSFDGLEKNENGNIPSQKLDNRKNTKKLRDYLIS